MNKTGSAMLLCCLLSVVAQAKDSPGLQLVEARRIWDQAPHNAFTDLIRFRDRWYCVFREGQGHVSPDGALRVITSSDGNEWQSAALISSENSDLWDAKITVTPDGRLMLAGAEAVNKPTTHRYQSLVWFSEDGRRWSEKHEVGVRDNWLWRITWHNDLLWVSYYASHEGKTAIYLAKVRVTLQ